MIIESMKLGENVRYGGESSETSPDRGRGLKKLGVDLFKESGEVMDGGELTLSYLCENSKGKEKEKEDKWVERDFLKMNDGSSKRESEEFGDCKKKVKLETQTLNLSLALPHVSLSESESPMPIPPPHLLKPSTRGRDSAISSNDFSYSYSLPFSHNPSCSFTHNSTDRDTDTDTHNIWNCGEGTNASVHSRFNPLLSATSRPLNPDTSTPPPSVSDNTSFFPSQLPALHHLTTHKLSKGLNIVRDLITHPIPLMSQLSRDLPLETIQSARDYLNYIMHTSDTKHELAFLQTLLQTRSDLTKETLSKSDPLQMEIFVAVKFGLPEFVSGKRIPTSELVEIFLYMRCRNVNCKSPLPVDDCDCKICLTKEGFCSQCMCPLCYNYDCANNTCTWVGCDACSHWCHAACGTDKKLIRPGPTIKPSSPSTEMQFYCLGCGHASEMFGFVKDVFLCCAKDWGLETLKKELDCVRRIFKASDDLKGKELYLKAAELINRLERRVISPSDACAVILHFFTSKPDTEDMAENAAASMGPKDSSGRQGCQLSDSFLTTNLARNSSLYNSGAMLKGVSPYENFRYNTPKPHISSERHVEDELSRKFPKKDIFELDSSDSIIRLKEEEARMFQNRADEARKEVNEYRQLVQAKTEKLEQEYSEKLAKLCLQDTEERRRRKLEELRIIESSHSDYFKMKIRMQAEISGLVERMEATKQLWV